MTVCKICAAETKPLFKAKVLHKYDVQYFLCTDCGFIQTEKEYWLSEAYADAIADLDIGYATRNVQFSEMVDSVIGRMFNRAGNFLDYGGGYGLFVRLMRDRGYNFFRQDIYCENIFSRHFDISDKQAPRHFDIVTAFEVFEHLEDPLAEVEKMLKYGKSILFTTQLQQKDKYESADEWWYFAPHSGQHIAIYSKRSLEKIGEKFGLNLYTNNKSFHLLTPKNFSINLIKYISYYHYIMDSIFSRHFNNRKSLLGKDTEFLKSISEKD